MISQSSYNFNLLREKNQASAKNIQRQLVIIDSQISNYQMLAAGVTPGTEVVILHPADDGIEQITAILCAGTTHQFSFPLAPQHKRSPAPQLPYTTVHIISHGEPGSLQLGNTTLNSQNLSRYTSQLYQWRKALGQSGNLIIYGCSVAAGSKGLSFIQQLHRILGSGIAAATTPVGNPALGGSWNLQQIYSPVPPSPHLPVSFAPPLPFSREVLEGYPGLFPATFPITDANWNTSVWNLGGAGGTPVWQAQSIPSSNPSDPYWLRLTPALTNRRGYAIYKEEFSSNDGIVVKFDYASYGGNGADGFSFFLVDADSNGDGVVNASDTVTIGAPPGGLGYASLPSSVRSGVTKGYVGIGFDEFGSFTRSDIGAGTDSGEWVALASPALPNLNNPPATADNIVAIRGAGNLLSGYTLLDSAQIGTPPAGPFIDGVVRSEPRTVQITIVNDFIEVEMDFGSGFISVLNISNLAAVNGTRPDFYKMGFGAATGGRTNVHEIRNLEISKPVDLSISKDDGLTDINLTDPITYTIIVSNTDLNDVTGAQVFDDFTGITGLNWTAVYAGGATGPANGTGAFNPTVDLPKNSSITFTVTGIVSQASLLSYATVTAPSDFRDVDETNNRDNDPTDVDIVNDAPSLSDNARLSPGINEDDTNPSGETITALFSSSFFDPDPGATFTGLAIVGNNANAATEGSWQYSTDSGTNWFDIGTVTDGTTALALSTSTKLRFLPALNYNGEPEVLTVRALDNTHSGGFTNGATRTTVDTSTNGDDTAISQVTKTLGTSVNPVNDAPSFTNNATLAAVNEDSTNPAGETVNNLFGSLFSDVDAGSSLGGIAVVGNTTANATTEGKWQYFLSNGPSWYDIDTVTDSSALVLSTTTKIRFLPVSNYNGTPPALTVRALDDTYTGNFATYNTTTSTLARNPVNVGSNGGITAIAGTPNTLSTSITAVNDPPTSADKTVTLNEDTSYTFSSADFAFADIDGDTFTSIKITSLPTAGTLDLGTTAVSIGAVIPVANIGNLKFTPDANANGLNYANFQFTVNDGTVDSSSANTFTFNVTAVNDPPTSLDKTVTLNEDTSYTFSSADFAFADIDGDTFTSIKITSLPTAGTLDLGTTAVSIGAVIPVANIGNLKFTPDANANGANYANFQFTVNDGTADSSSANTITMNVTAVNDPPTSLDKTVNLNEDSTYTFSSADFAFIDPDASDTLTSIKITSLPTAGTGTFLLGTTAVNVGDVIPVANIGNLKFTPAANANGANYANFQFTVNDGTADSSSANTITLNVTAVNDAPTSADNTITVTEDTPYTFKLADFPFNDIDGDSLQSITISQLPGAGTLLLDGVPVAPGQVISALDIAKLTFTPAPDGNGTNYASFPFTVNDGNGNSTPSTMTLNVTAVDDPPTSGDNSVTLDEDSTYTFSAADFAFADPDGDPLQSITISQLPGAGTLLLDGQPVAPGQVISAADIAKLTFTPAPDGNGTNYANFQFTVTDGTGNSTPATMSLNVTAVNDAPTSADSSVTLDEDTPYTFKLADFPFNDIDGDSLASITISQLPGAGTLLLDGQPVAPGQVISAADIAKLTFTPAPDASGANYANFQFTVNDGTGNSTPATMSLNVTAVNDAPTSADNTVTLNEDSTYSFLATDFAFTDTDGGTFTSIKITSLPTPGTLQLDGVAVTTNQVIPVGDIPKLSFAPVADGNGTNYANFQFTVNDGTGDGTTPNTITLNVTPVNDKPSFTAIDPAHVSFNAGAQNIQNWAIFNPGAANEVGQTGTYTVNPTSITNPGLFAVPPAVDANGNLTYTPAPGVSGTSDFQVVVQDNGGTANGGVDTSDLQTFTITVHPADAPVNNAPNFTGNATLTPPVAQDSTEPPSMTISNLFGGLFNDPDAGDSLSGIAVVGNTADPVTEGSWQYSPDGINWFDIGTVGDGPNALALSATSFIRFLPVPGYNGTPQPLTVRAVDNTYTGGFSGLNRANIDTSNPGGNSPIAGSTNSITTSVAAYIDGTDDDDLLDGGDGNDAITGGLGNDTLAGNDGDDAIDGGDGQDIIDGGPGDDNLTGSNDNDTISGGDNNDTVSGGNGDDSLDGGVGDDSLTGGDGNDTLIGGGGADTLLGGDGDDVYEVDLGNAAGTVISDASGNDKLVVNNGTLTLDEPPGVPVIRQDNNLVIDLNGNGVQDDDADIVIVDFFDPEDGPGSGFIEDLGNLSGTDVVNSLGGTTPPPPPPPPEEEPGTGVVTPATPTATGNDSQASPDIVAPEMDCTAPEMDCTCPTIPPPPTVSYDVPMMDPSLAGAGDDVIFGGAGGDFLLGYTGNDYLQGNSGGDIIIGGNGSEQPLGASGDRDIIFGNPGNDILQGSEGNDIIYAGQDDDIAHGGKDDDLMYGDRGSDTLMGDLGNDVIFGGPGEPELANEDATDYIYGGAGDDFLNGNQGNDFLSGGVGNDTIYGGQDNDVARGEEGNDLLFGDKGNDTFCGGNGDDTLYGGTGSDIGIGDSGEQDKLLGGAGNDFINGNEGKDSICGGDGNDTIYGGKDNDIARGEEGNDLLFGDKGNDTFCGGNGDDTLYGGTGSDIGIGDSGEQDKLLGGAGNDFINGNEGNDSICGGDGNDTIYGGKDDDLINAGAGDDLILGDLGNDTITGGDGRDTFVLRAGAGSDIIIDFTDGVDFLGLSGGLSFADLSISGDANATLIKFGDELLATLGGVNFSLINQADFSLV